MRDHLLNACVKNGLHDLAEVLKGDSACGLHNEVIACAGLCHCLHLILALKSAHGEELNGVSAHLLYHGDGCVNGNDGRLLGILGKGTGGDLYHTGSSCGRYKGIDVCPVIVHIGSGIAYC